MTRVEQELVPGLTRGTIWIWVLFIFVLGATVGAGVLWCGLALRGWARERGQQSKRGRRGSSRHRYSSSEEEERPLRTR